LFSTVRIEVGERFESCAHAKDALLDDTAVVHNRRRHRSTLGHISAAVFE
jgi:hypothetical protein